MWCEEYTTYDRKMNFPKKPLDELLNMVREALNLPRSAVSILETLLREEEATIEKIVRLTSISRKTVHEHLKKMRALGLVRRKPSEVRGRLLYVYSAVPFSEIISLLRGVFREKLKGLEELERSLGGGVDE